MTFDCLEGCTHLEILLIEAYQYAFGDKNWKKTADIYQAVILNLAFIFLLKLWPTNS